MNSYNILERDGIYVNRAYDWMRKCCNIVGRDCRTGKRAGMVLDERAFGPPAVLAGVWGGPRKDAVERAAEEVYRTLSASRASMFGRFAPFLADDAKMLPLLGSFATKAAMYYDWLLPERFANAAAIGWEGVRERSREWRADADWVWEHPEGNYAKYSMTMQVKHGHAYTKVEFLSVKGVLLDLMLTEDRWVHVSSWWHGTHPQKLETLVNETGDVVGFATF